MDPVTQMLARAARGGVSYYADAAVYIAATGELFPSALNTLVLELKAAGFWGSGVVALKKAIGVPSLSASLVDLVTPALTGSAGNTPGHSATQGWILASASSQYIDSGFSGASHASQNSIHVGARVKAYANAANQEICGALNAGATAQIRLLLTTTGNLFARINDASNLSVAASPTTPGHYIGSRTASNAKASYKSSSQLATAATASTGDITPNVFVGARNNNGSPDTYFSGRITMFHAGAGLDATQAAAVTALCDAYATAAGEA